MNSRIRIAVLGLMPSGPVIAAYEREPSSPAAPVPLDHALTVCFE